MVVEMKSRAANGFAALCNLRSFVSRRRAIHVTELSRTAEGQKVVTSLNWNILLGAMVAAGTVPSVSW
jgi:hypothetical protein